jgi:hypothetical protein
MDHSDTNDWVKEKPDLFALVEAPRWGDARFLDTGSLQRPKRSSHWKSHLRQILAFGGDTTGIFL